MIDHNDERAMKPVSIRHHVSEAVREALLLLAQERLVSHSRNCGFSVVNLTGEDRKKVRQIRLPLETLSFERLSGSAFKVSIPDLTPRLPEAMHQCYVEYLSGESTRTAEECVRFH